MNVRQLKIFCKSEMGEYILPNTTCDMIKQQLA